MSAQGQWPDTAQNRKGSGNTGNKIMGTAGGYSPKFADLFNPPWGVWAKYHGGTETASGYADEHDSDSGRVFTASAKKKSPPAVIQ